MYHLDVRNVVSIVVAAVHSQRVLYRVEALACGTVADGVKVRLEAVRVKSCDGLLEQLRLHERDAGIVARVTVPVFVWRKHRGREVLRDAVLHDLDARRGEATSAKRGPAVYQLGYLLEPARAIPPQRPHNASGKRPLCTESEISGAGVTHVRVVPYYRVLPRGDTKRVQVLLRHEQCTHAFVERGVGDEVADHLHRALVERSGWLAIDVPFDAAVAWVRRGGGDSGQFERSRVDPRAMRITVEQEHRAVGDRGIQQAGGWGAARERRHRPSAANDPLEFWVGRRVPRHEVH